MDRVFLRDDGETELHVEYEITSWGYPSNGWDDDGAAPEVEIDKAWLLEDASLPDPPLVTLTADEEERFCAEVCADPDTYDDGGPDPDDERDRLIDDRLTGGDR